MFNGLFPRVFFVFWSAMVVFTVGFVAISAVTLPEGPVWPPMSAPTIAWQMALLIAISGAVAFVLARRLARPIQALRTATGRVAAGELDVRVSAAFEGTAGEVAALGRAFDRMTERVAGLLDVQKRLLRDISHELRSPLARMEVALELARKDAGPTGQPILDRIGRETERLSVLIGDVLALSRLDAAHQGGGEASVDLDLTELVRGVVADAEFEAHGHQWHVQLAEPAQVVVRGRPEALRRAIENVVRNAARFAGPGSTVEVSLQADAALATVIIRDRGPGLPPEALTRVFEPFFRVTEDRDRKTGGVGLGLAIAHRAVTLHGGRISVQNRSGGGLEVTLDVPKTPVEGAKSAGPSRPPLALEGGPPR